ncbi:TetR family transcriptional regulator [Streptomyces sp. NPDC055254]
MGYKHSRNDMLEAAAGILADDGLTALTYRRLGERLGLPDRTVVYYFPTKAILLAAALDRHADHLRTLLHAAVGDTPLTPTQLLHRAWSGLRTAQADVAFRVLIEVLGHAAAGRAPYRELAATLAAQWNDWLTGHLTGPPGQRQRHAAALLAQLDGLLLLRSIGHDDLADEAARTLGWRPPFGSQAGSSNPC